jgi:hypothetical protein
MPGPASSVANVNQGSAFYVNVVAISTVAAGDCYDATGTAFALGAPAPDAPAAGTFVVRDLGKTIRVPAQSSSGTVQRVLRLVQRLDAGARTAGAFPVSNGFVGFNDGVGGAAASGSNANGYQTFYIDVTEGKFARLSL